MDQVRLDAIKERVAMATPGPWESGQIVGKRSYCVIDDDSFVARKMTRKDSEFIAHAREDVPALVAEIEDLHELRKDDFLVLCDAKEEVKAIQQENARLQELLEGNDGMSVAEIRNQFVDLHRDFLQELHKNKKLREALDGESND